MNARQKRQEKGIGLLDMCLDLHMSNTGSSDPLPKDEYEFYIENLAQTIIEWDLRIQTLLFDNTVKELVLKTLTEDSIVNKGKRPWEYSSL